MKYVNRALAVVVGVLALPLIYILSIGPAWLLVNMGRLDFRVFRRCYDPLVEVATVLGLVDWLRWYMELWR